jgi:hypothetical protein
MHLESAGVVNGISRLGCDCAIDLRKDDLGAVTGPPDTLHP